MANSTNNEASTPRWVKIFGVGALVLLLFFVLHLVLGGFRGHSQ